MGHKDRLMHAYPKVKNVYFSSIFGIKTSIKPLQFFRITCFFGSLRKKIFLILFCATINFQWHFPTNPFFGCTKISGSPPLLRRFRRQRGLAIESFRSHPTAHRSFVAVRLSSSRRSQFFEVEILAENGNRQSVFLPCLQN